MRKFLYILYNSDMTEMLGTVTVSYINSSVFSHNVTVEISQFFQFSFVHFDTLKGNSENEIRTKLIL